MRTREQIETAIFRQPFALRGLTGARPAGACIVETSEERPECVPFAAWRWLSTVIRLEPDPELKRSASIEPDDLDAALARGGAAAEIRHESVARHAHRAGKKALFAMMRSEKNARIAAERLTRARSGN